MILKFVTKTIFFGASIALCGILVLLFVLDFMLNFKSVYLSDGEGGQ